MHGQDGEHDQRYLPEGEQPTAPQSTPSAQSGSTMPESELRTMNIATLIACCMRELNNYRRGEVSNDRYGVELFRRAICQCDSDSWTALQLCFGDTVRS